MSTTEAVGGECPRCANTRCFLRTGTGTWYTYIACPECGFAYGEHADNITETNGIVTGAYVFHQLMQRYSLDSMADLREFATEPPDSDLFRAGDTIFDFEDDDKHTLAMCVAPEPLINSLPTAPA